MHQDTAPLSYGKRFIWAVTHIWISMIPSFVEHEFVRVPHVCEPPGDGQAHTGQSSRGHLTCMTQPLLGPPIAAGTKTAMWTEANNVPSAHLWCLTTQDSRVRESRLKQHELPSLSLSQTGFVPPACLPAILLLCVLSQVISRLWGNWSYLTWKIPSVVPWESCFLNMWAQHGRLGNIWAFIQNYLQ